MNVTSGTSGFATFTLQSDGGPHSIEVTTTGPSNSESFTDTRTFRQG